MENCFQIINTIGVDLKVSENIVQYVAAASKGDTDAMAKLYSKTLKASYFLASALSAEDSNAVDITKKAYAKAFSSIDKLKRPEAFEIWMKQNVAAAYKEGKKFVFADADAGAAENSSEFLSEDVFEDEEKSAGVLKAVSELRPELRAAIILHYNNGMPVSIIAKFFGVSESTANALLGKARANVLAGAGLEADSSSSGSLPVLTRIFQRAAAAISIDNTVVRDVFIYAIDAYEASKPAVPAEEEQPVPAPVEAPVEEEKPAEEPVQEAVEAPAEPEAAPAEEAPQSNIISFKQKINELLDNNGESAPEAAEEVPADDDAEDAVEIPAFVPVSEEAERAVEQFSSYEKPEAPASPAKKKLNIKLNKKIIGIACACLAVVVVICVAIGVGRSDAPAGNEGSNAVETVAAGYKWVEGGFAECAELEYLDETCAYFKSASTGKYGLIDYQGNVILQPNYDGFKRCATGRDYENGDLYHSLVIINGEEYEISVDNGLASISQTPHIDHSVSNAVLEDTSYDERDRYFEGYAAARKDGKWGYVSQEKDKRVIKYEYDAVNEFSSALDSAGSDYCRPVTNGLVAVKKDGAMGIIDLKNKTVVPFEYSNILPGSNGVFIACKGGTWGVILVGDAVASFGGVNISVDPLSPGMPEDITSSGTNTLGSYTVISEDGANVRGGAGSDYDLLGELEYGDTVVAYETKRADNGNKWAKIKYNGEYGWVALSMLEEEGA